jgi:hypothetical protein
MPPTFTSNEALPITSLPAHAATPPADLLLCLPAIPPDALTAALETISTAFPTESVLVASTQQPEATPSNLTLLPYSADRSTLGWVLAASDYASAAKLAAERNTATVLLLADAPTDPTLLRSLVDAIRTQSIDLAVPRFHLGPTGGLVNSALLYPLTRALFGTDIRFPLPSSAALSMRFTQRLASAAQRLVAVNQGSSLFWPVAEAAIAGLSVREVDAPNAQPPAPPQEDFNALFTTVAGSLFSDIESRATFWQRARAVSARPTPDPVTPYLEAATVDPDILSLIDSFHLAQANLQEIWSLVLPPQSRLAFKKLAQLPPDQFTLDPHLWARTVYDFALAFHLRTLNRNHLLGAMTPLYLAWVASHLRAVSDDPSRAVQTTDQTANAFESEKPYFVSRWRWPDRFNP